MSMGIYGAEEYRESNRLDRTITNARRMLTIGAIGAIAFVAARGIENDPSERNPLLEGNNQVEMATPVPSATPDVYILPDAGSSDINPVSSAEAAPQD